MNAPEGSVARSQPLVMRILVRPYVYRHPRAREGDVLALMAEGRSNGAIAGTLVVSERAVEPAERSYTIRQATAGQS